MWNTVTPVALPTTQSLETYNLKAGNTNSKWNLYILSQAETAVTVSCKHPSK